MCQPFVNDADGVALLIIALSTTSIARVDDGDDNTFDFVTGAPCTRCALQANKFCFSDALEANVDGEDIICGSAMLDDGDATDEESGAKAFVSNYYEDDEEEEDALVPFCLIFAFLLIF